MTTNPGYSMDAQRLVLETIAEDTPFFIFESMNDFYGQKPLDIIDTASELIVPEQPNNANWLQSRAFIAGCLAVMVAFHESDCGGQRIGAVNDRFFNQALTDVIDLKEHKSSKTIIEEMHSCGLRAHVEIIDHLDFIANYYEARGNYVYVGGGFCTYALDRCYEKVIDDEVAVWAGKDVQDINWDELLDP